MNRIVWTMPDGSIRVSTPAAPMLEGETESEYLDRVAARTKTALPDLRDAVRVSDITPEAHKKMRENRKAK